MTARPRGNPAIPPPRTDPMSAYWVLAVVGIFLLIFVLSFFGLPSRLFPEATASPFPSGSPFPSESLPAASAPEEPAPSPSVP